MMRLSKSLLMVAVLLGAAPVAAGAQEAPPEEPLTRPSTGVGVQLTWPAYGVSGILDLGDRLSVQAVLGVGYGLGLTGRALYRLTPQELFTPYGYGALGYWSSYSTFGGVPNFGAGVGAEADLRRFIEDLPPLFGHVEAGIGGVAYSGGTWLFFQVGPAIHYRF